MFYSVHHILIVNILVHISSYRYWGYMLNNCFDGVPYAVWKQMALRTILHLWFCFWLIFKSKSQCPNFSCMHTLSRNSAHANTGTGTNPPLGVGRDTRLPRQALCTRAWAEGERDAQAPPGPQPGDVGQMVQAGAIRLL